MSKTMSHFQILANKSNALHSTGPRTDLGKVISSMNSTKHGFCSTSTSLDEDQDEVQQAHGRWTKSLNPHDEVSRALTDLSFKQKRQLDRVFAAEDAAVAERVAAVEFQVVEDRRQFNFEADLLFIENPIEAYPRLRVTADGVLSLLGKLDRLEMDAELGAWGPTHTRYLLAIEGVRDPEETDPFLESAVRIFDRAKKASLSAQLKRDSTDPESIRERDGALADLRDLAPAVAQHRDGLLARIKKEMERLQEERYVAHFEEAKLVRMQVDRAKVDDSPEGRLRRRYIADAQRDFLRSLKAAQAACAAPKSHSSLPETAQPEAPAEEAKATTAAASPARNEPKFDHVEDDDDAGRAAAPTDVRRRRRA